MSSTVFLVLSVLMGASVALDCTQIPDSSVKPGYTAYIPAGSQQPVALPPNYNCTYAVTVPAMVYAHVRLENQLKGGNDVIYVRDAMAKRTIVSSRTPPVMDFYVFPGTTTTFQVLIKSVDVGSKFRMSVSYINMPAAAISQVGSDLKYFALNDLQVNAMKPPQNVQSNQQVVVTLADSQYPGENFDDYYIVDGTLSAHKGIYHLSDYQNRNFVSSGRNLTVVGLNNHGYMSSVIISNLQVVENFYDFTGATTYYDIHSVNVNGINKREGLTVISKNTNSVIFTGFKYLERGDDPQCSVRAMTSPVTSNSQQLLDFKTVKAFPYTLNQKYFTIVVEGCSVAFTMYSE